MNPDEIVIAIFLFYLFVASYPFTVKLCIKFLVLLSAFSPFCSVEKPVFLLNRLKQVLLLFLEVNNVRVRRKRIHNFFWDVRRSTWVTGNAHVRKCAGKPIVRRALKESSLNIKSNLLIKICRIKYSRVGVMPYDLVAYSCRCST